MIAQPKAALLVSILVATLVLVMGDDTATVRQRLLDLLCMPPPGQLPGVIAEAGRFEQKLLPNGTWPDINYNDSTDRAVWQTSQHLNRVTTMAQAVSAGAGGTALVNSTRLALGWWSRVDPQNVNWWYDIIFVPQAYSSIYLLLGVAPTAQAAGFPSPPELTAGLRNMFRAAWWNASLGYEVSGANLAWMLQVGRLRVRVLQSDSLALDLVRSHLVPTILLCRRSS